MEIRYLYYTRFLTGNQVDLPYNGDILSDSAQTLVINVVVPNGTSELNLFGSTIGQLNVGGTNIMNEKGGLKPDFILYGIILMKLEIRLLEL